MGDCLVLNSTYQPLNVTSIARAVRLVLCGKAEVVHENGVLAAPSIAIPFP